MQTKEKKRIITGGLILITLGLLILLDSLQLYGFNKSWPILLLAVGAGSLLQSWRDKTGWFISFVGALFLLKENLYGKLNEFTTYGVPLILIVIGIYVLLKGTKR